MKTKKKFAVVGAFVVTGLLGVPIAQCSQPKGTKVDYEALAQKLVT